MDLTVDPERVKYDNLTGIFVRAKHAGVSGSYDVAQLDRESLKRWLLSRNDTVWMGNVIGVILGHGCIMDEPKDSG